MLGGVPSAVHSLSNPLFAVGSEEEEKEIAMQGHCEGYSWRCLYEFVFHIQKLTWKMHLIHPSTKLSINLFYKY